MYFNKCEGKLLITTFLGAAKNNEKIFKKLMFLKLIIYKRKETNTIEKLRDINQPFIAKTAHSKRNPVPGSGILAGDYCFGY